MEVCLSFVLRWYLGKASKTPREQTVKRSSLSESWSAASIPENKYLLKFCHLGASLALPQSQSYFSSIKEIQITAMIASLPVSSQLSAPADSHVFVYGILYNKSGILYNAKCLAVC